MNSSLSPGDELEQLRNTISQLSLVDAFKTKQIELLENKYGKTITLLNDYINQLHKVLNLKTNESEFISLEELKEVLVKDDELQTKNFIIIPKKLIKPHQGSIGDKKTPASASSIASMKSKDSHIGYIHTDKKGRTNHQSKTKLSCSYCKESGHKRSHCPKILYKDI